MPMKTLSSMSCVRRLLVTAGLTPVMLASAAGLAAAATPAFAQPAQDTASMSNQELLRDFIHFVRIARYDVAEDLGRALLDKNLQPAEFLDVLEESGEEQRFNDTIARASRVSDISEIAEELRQLYTDGKLSRARNPDEIARNIELVRSGTFRGVSIGRSRLKAAGEYALPQLLEVYLSDADAALRAEVQSLLIEMGRDSVIPLVTALSSLDAQRQEQVVNILRRIPYRTSAPFLADLADSAESGSVRGAANRALETLGVPTDVAPSQLYTSLSEAYYNEQADVTNFPNEEFQLVWSFDPGSGLNMTAVRTEVFHEAMAMRLAERALRLNPNSDEALALWVAANLSREIDSPENYQNPVYPASRRSAEYYAVASGAETAQRVLDRALSDRDTRLARRAVSALERTAGTESLLYRTDDGVQPMIEALTFPSRRVQYEAALTIARSQPANSFADADNVIRTLSAAVRGAGERYAAVVTQGNREEYDRLRSLLEQNGFSVLPPDTRGIADLDASVADVPAVDLVVLSVSSGERAAQEIDTARSNWRLQVTPLLALVPSIDEPRLDARFDSDDTVTITPERTSAAAMRSLIDDLTEAALGGTISAADAEVYASRAMSALRELAVAGNTALDVAQAESVLIEAVRSRSGDTRQQAADVLAFIGTGRAQSALAETASEGGGHAGILNALADSAKRYGAMLDRRLLTDIVEVSNSGDQDVATAAAAALGALGVTGDRVVPMILGDDGDMPMSN